ncbi:hypothetical protein [Halomonas sp. QHL1]|uniref:hypothetical protein n=1 Tax=Halomonas sp. QHL1 TaxID=1123773 RepID=UPI0008FD2098|nr:hypothetical protein [Halomonas sp. QHL1]OJA04993.1 hypothetical protein QHL1GM_06090 [Halomonas sp. QHL1]
MDMQMIKVKITFAEDVTEDFAHFYGTTDPTALISGEVYEGGEKLLDIEETLVKVDGQWRAYIGDAPSNYHKALQKEVDAFFNFERAY